MSENILICPKCSCGLEEINGSLICENRHTYDLSASGYVNFNTKLSISGDSPDMVNARSRFLDLGYYEGFAREIVSTLDSFKPEKVIDAGCGEGYYSNMIAKELDYTSLYGFDLSKSAVNKASKRARASGTNARFFVCGIFDLPIRENSIDAVVSLFAPLAYDEFHRVLKPGGRLVIGAAGKEHLLGLKRALYSDVYENNPEKVVSPEGFRELSRNNIRYDVSINTSQAISDLFSMTPYYWKTGEDAAARLSELDKLDTALDFDIIVFERL